MKNIQWVLVNGAFAACLYFGYIEGVEGALRVAFFLAWFAIICSLPTASEEVRKKMRENGRTIPAWVSVPFDIAVTVVFVWFGAWVTGAFYVLHILLLHAAWNSKEGKL